MFTLFLQGHTTEEIAAQNPAFGLGIIVRARIDHGWDEQRAAHLKNLTDNIRQLVQTTQLSAVRFVSDGLAVYQRLAGEKFQKYLQSGNAADLGDFKDMGFKQYKELLELLLKLTGQGEQKKVSGEVLHTHIQQEAMVGAPIPRLDQPMTSIDADDFLKRLDTGVKISKKGKE